jgi:hypothetical protein
MTTARRKAKKGFIWVKPLKDWPLFCPPHFEGQLKEGVEIEIPELLKQSLTTEGVIKES